MMGSIMVDDGTDWGTEMNVYVCMYTRIGEPFGGREIAYKSYVWHIAIVWLC